MTVISDGLAVDISDAAKWLEDDFDHKWQCLCVGDFYPSHEVRDMFEVTDDLGKALKGTLYYSSSAATWSAEEGLWVKDGSNFDPDTRL